MMRTEFVRGKAACKASCMIDWQGAAAAAEDIASAWSGGPGGAFVLFDQSGVQRSVCGGLASIEHAIPFTADTPTRYASISKHMLATMLLAAGAGFDRPLGLPDLPAAWAAVPLGRALDMTGGLPDMMEMLWQQGVPFTATVRAAEIGAAMRRQTRLGSVPGAEMAYSNTGWRLGQAVLEARMGLPYGAALQDALFGPLGLGMAFPDDETAPVPRLATGYWHDGAMWRRGRYGMHVSASGGVTGSGTDLARWAGALMAGRAPLAGVLDRLLAPRPFADGTPSAYRLGLVETTLGDTRIAAHSGALPGYRNHLLMAPALGIGLVLLMNRDADPLPPALRVMAALLGEPPPEPSMSVPTGLYAAADGPAWAESMPGALVFMGGAETLLPTATGHRSVPSTLEMEVTIAPDAINGRIGGPVRALHRVPDGITLDPALVGTWREPEGGAVLRIHKDGTATWPWLVGIEQTVPLTPLPGARAIASLQHLMWRHRPSLVLQPNGTLLIASHRARVHHFVREHAA